MPARCRDRTAAQTGGYYALRLAGAVARPHRRDYCAVLLSPGEQPEDGAAYL